MSVVNAGPGVHARRPDQPRVEVFVDRTRRGDHAAVVVLHGEHDLTTSEGVRVALAPLRGSVLVDLSPCTFIDSTIISILVEQSHRLVRDGSRLDLRVSAGGQVAETVALMRLGDVLRVL
jgi:anti-anti-sigma regulatory factor